MSCIPTFIGNKHRREHHPMVPIASKSTEFVGNYQRVYAADFGAFFRQRKRQKLRGFDFFIVIQRKGHDFGIARVSAMNGSTSVPQMSLCLAFRHASGAGPLCPTVAIAMKSHATDSDTKANFAEMTGAFVFA